jgi:RNA polymerase sigma-70 factor (ECF subfamily)
VPSYPILRRVSSGNWPKCVERVVTLGRSGSGRNFLEPPATTPRAGGEEAGALAKFYESLPSTPRIRKTRTAFAPDVLSLAGVRCRFAFKIGPSGATHRIPQHDSCPALPDHPLENRSRFLKHLQSHSRVLAEILGVMPPLPEQERFMCLWSSAQPAVSNYVHSLLRDHALAKDVLQETALVLFRRFSEYHEERPFLAWALGIARFQVLGVQRDAARNLVSCDEELLSRFTETWAEIAPEATDRAAALQTCLGRLAAHANRMVRLRYFEELDSEQIAQQIGGTGASVRSALKRVREQLRLCVEKQLSAEGGLG